MPEKPSWRMNSPPSVFGIETDYSKLEEDNE